MNGSATSPAVARTPGATRAVAGEYVFEMAKVNHLMGGPDYSTVHGSCVEGDRMIAALMRMPAGTGADLHSHLNEQWIYVIEGTMQGEIGGTPVTASAGTALYIPAEVLGNRHCRRHVFHREGCLAQSSWHEVCSQPVGLAQRRL